jgi:multiple sugar transport system ATP-binding protein
MGRAMVRAPKVFLFDEPLSNLDAKLRVQMRSEIKQNHQRLKTTTIYVTHDQIEAMTMADRIVVMNDGRIEQIGSPLELYDHPANLFVAGFIGSPAINILAGKAEQGGFVASDGTCIALPLLARGADGGDVTMGIRPEHFRIDPQGLKAEIITVEPTGSETQVFLRLAGHDMVGVFRERITATPGETLRLGVDPSGVHFFDSKTGLRKAA